MFYALETKRGGWEIGPTTPAGAVRVLATAWRRRRRCKIFTGDDVSEKVVFALVWRDGSRWDWWADVDALPGVVNAMDNAESRRTMRTMTDKQGEWRTR